MRYFLSHPLSLSLLFALVFACSNPFCGMAFAQCPPAQLELAAPGISPNVSPHISKEAIETLQQKIDSVNQQRDVPHCLEAKVTLLDPLEITIVHSKEVSASDLIYYPIIFRRSGAMRFIHFSDFRDSDGNLVLVDSKSYLTPLQPMQVVSLNLDPALKALPGPVSEMARAHGMAYLTHKTPCRNVQSILEHKAIKSGKSIGKNNFMEVVGFDQVFLQCVAENQLTTEMRVYEHGEEPADCTLFFSLDLLDHEDYLLNDDWSYGRLERNSVSIRNPSLIPGFLDSLAQKSSGSHRGISRNEVVFSSPVSLQYLQHITVPKTHSDLLKYLAAFGFTTSRQGRP